MKKALPLLGESNASTAKLQYLGVQQRCIHDHRSKPVDSHPNLSRPNKRSNLLSSLLPCLASTTIMKPFEERYFPGLQVIKQRGDKRTPRHRSTALRKTKMDARGDMTSMRLRDIRVFADLTLSWQRNAKLYFGKATSMGYFWCLLFIFHSTIMGYFLLIILAMSYLNW